MVGQVGTAEKARDFLGRLGRNQAVQDMVYVTSDQLDDMFIKFKDNEKHLDRWVWTLFVMLCNQQANAPGYLVTGDLVWAFQICYNKLG